MNHETIITNISHQKSDYKHPSQAEDLANSLDTISDDIYSESERFIYELIQNADDASNQGQQDLEIMIEFTENYVVISHNGREFNEKDILAISSVGKSQKSENPNQTGYKGIGFKSVFGKSDCVYIHSNGFCFRYDRKHWQNQEYKMPWQIIPLWSDILPELNPTNFSKFPVSTAIQFDNQKGFNKNELKQTLIKLFSNSQIMLFLRNVTVISVDKDFVIRRTKNLINEKQVSETEQLILSSVSLNTNTETTNWIIGDFIGIEIENDIKNALKYDEKAPKRLKESQFTNISFAGMVNHKGELVEIKDNSLIFTYLPTKINKGFPFLVNADFMTNAPREGFHEDRPWNIWLFGKVACKTFEWLKELAQTEYKYQIAHLIPTKFQSENKMEKSFNEGFKQAIKKINFIPNENDELLLVSNVLIDKTGIDEVIATQTLIDYYNTKNETKFSINSIANKKLKSQKDFKDIGVKTFEVKDLESFFDSDIFKTEFALKQNFKLIKFLHKKTNSKISSELWSENISNLSFIFNEQEDLCSPNNPIYFPNSSFETQLNQKLDFVHNEVLEKINENHDIKNWLFEIGIKEPTKKNIINDLSKTISKLTNDREKSIEIVRYLFENQNEIDDFSKFSQILLVTTKNYLLAAEDCYLSDFYKPELAIEDYLDNIFFVSNAYVIEGKSVKEWNLFLTKIGVKDNFSWVTKQKNSYNSDFDSDFFKLKTGFPNPGYPNPIQSYEINYISFVDKIINNHKFSKFFWTIVFQSNLPLNNGIDKGKTWFHGWKALDIIPYFEWLIKNIRLFPTSYGNCVKASDIIINRPDFKKIGGDNLPILDLDIELPQRIESNKSVFNFRNTIELPEYLNVLDVISWKKKLEIGVIHETTERIGLIYQNLLNFVSTYEKQEIQQWANRNKILSTTNEFVKCSELHYLDIENFETPKEVKGFVKIPNEVKLKNDFVNLLKLFGVKIINQNSLETKKEKIEKESELQMRLVNQMPLIALVVANKENCNYERTLKELQANIAKAQFYKAQKLYLDCTLEGKQIFTIQKTALAENNQFHYVGNWHSPITLYDLTGELCKFLDIKNIEKELNVLLLVSFSEGLEWLENQKYDTSKVPQQAEETDKSYGGDFRTNSQKDTSEIMGEISEKFVFHKLIEVYKNKYANESIELENASIFKTKNVEIVWHRAAGNRYANRDITITENNVEKYFEVKATIGNENVDSTLFLSYNEWSLMKESKNRYFLARVFNGINPNKVIFVKMDKTETIEL